MGLSKSHLYRSVSQEEAFWQTRQAKLRQMSGLHTTDQDSLKHRDQENTHAGYLSGTLQLDWKVGLSHVQADLPTLAIPRAHSDTVHAG